MGIVSWIDKKFYKDYSNNWDDLLFRQRILKNITKNSKILDVGAGAGIVTQMHFKGLVKKMCGIDLDPRVELNQALDEGILADAEKIPYEDETFDMVFADNVMEHLANPYKVFTELSRVLKPDGLLLFKTPNRSHYMPLISRLTPLSFHKFINKIRGRESTDTFPTHYLVNSRFQVTKLAERTGFILHKLDLVEGRPEYLRITFFTYFFGLMYERVVNFSDIFSPWRILIIAELRKKN